MNKSAGYSLFEVLIAFAIMALVLAVIIPGQAALLRRTQNMDEAVLAQDYAASLMAKIGYETPLRPGDTELTYRGWRVVQNTEDGQELEGGVATYDVRIEVFSVAGENRLAHLTKVQVAP